MSMKMLIADDNRQILSILRDYAGKEGFETVLADDGEKALSAFYKEHFDIVLLDVMMPKLDGFEVCLRIRKKSNMPIIMITARGEDYERIMGLDIGADDYIVKPFSPAEAMARVRAILRRLDRTVENAESQQLFLCGNLMIRLDEFRVTIGGNELALTKKELELLWTLATNRNLTYSREKLLDTVWGYDYCGETRTVDSHIKRLRAKTDVFEHPDWAIKTVWGSGYKFEVMRHEE